MSQLKEIKDYLKRFAEKVEDHRELLPADEFRSMKTHWTSVSRDASLRAAKYFGLDLNDEIDRALMVGVLARALFPKAGRGRKKGSYVWDGERLLILGERLRKLVAAYPRMSDSEAARKLPDLYPEYKHLNWQMLRQRLPDARFELEVMKTDGIGATPPKDPDEFIAYLGKFVHWLMREFEYAEDPSKSREEQRAVIRRRYELGSLYRLAAELKAEIDDKPPRKSKNKRNC
jgi:hypothetical protein